MKETKFIDQNKKKWNDFEGLLKQSKKNPDKLSDLFIQITDDLSFSRTHYPNRSVRVYLNNIAQKVFLKIYKNKKRAKWKNFANFWTDELPQVLYHSRRELLISFLVFAVSMVIGVFSSAYNPDFAEQIMGESYMEMTKENISSGDPMAVYKKGNSMDMFLGITSNNIRVALFAFFLGLLFSVGTIGVIIKNGIMLGAFQYFFYEKGLFAESFLTIWQHGTLEISAIIIAGAAGITLGSGLIFPGTYSRLQSFQISGIKSVKIMIGVIPILIIAGFIESFETRHTEIPDPIRLLVILLSLSFIIGYFMILPAVKAKKGFKKELKPPKLAPKKKQQINYNQIKTNGEIFTETYVLFKKSFSKIILFVLSIGLIYTAIYKYALPAYVSENIEAYMEFFILSNVPYFFGYHITPTLFLLNLFAFSFAAFVINHYMIDDVNGESSDKDDFLTSFKNNILKYILITGLLHLTMFIENGFSGALFILLLPQTFIWLFIAHKEKIGVHTAIARVFRLQKGISGKMYSLYILKFFMGILFYFILGSPLLFFTLESISMNFFAGAELFISIFMIFINITALLIISPLLIISCNLQYFSFVEINEAKTIKQRIAEFGKERKVRA